MDFLFGLLSLHFFTAQIIVEKIKTGVVRGDDPDSFDVALNVDSGLGALDALFASLSMILVSEVSNFRHCILFLLLFTLRWIFG